MVSIVATGAVRFVLLASQTREAWRCSLWSSGIVKAFVTRPGRGTSQERSTIWRPSFQMTVGGGSPNEKKAKIIKFLQRLIEKDYIQKHALQHVFQYLYHKKIDISIDAPISCIICIYLFVVIVGYIFSQWNSVSFIYQSIEKLVVPLSFDLALTTI